MLQIFCRFNINASIDHTFYRGQKNDCIIRFGANNANECNQRGCDLHLNSNCLITKYEQPIHQLQLVCIRVLLALLLQFLYVLQLCIYQADLVLY